MEHGSDPLERELARLTRLRARGAPALDELVAGARTRQRQRRMVWGLAAAAALLLVLSWPRVRTPQGRPPQAPTADQLEALGNWRAPTDAFLPVSGGWTAEVPDLGRPELTIYTGQARKESS